jgi:lipopolysaccharide transport system ATP-binding protein
MAEGAPEAVLRQYRNAMEAEENADPPPASATAADAASPETFDDGWADPRLGTNPVAVSPFLADSVSHGHGGATIDDAWFSDADGRRLDRVQGGSTVVLHIAGRAESGISRPIVGFILRDGLGQNLFGDNTFLEYHDRPRAMEAGDRYAAVFEFQLPYLPTGVYTIAPSIIDGTQQNHIQLYWMEEALVLTVDQSPVRFGKVGIPIRVKARLGA